MAPMHCSTGALLALSTWQLWLPYTVVQGPYTSSPSPGFNLVRQTLLQVDGRVACVDESLFWGTNDGSRWMLLAFFSLL